jgi:hypothetical protein
VRDLIHRVKGAGLTKNLSETRLKRLRPRHRLFLTSLYRFCLFGVRDNRRDRERRVDFNSLNRLKNRPLTILREFHSHLIASNESVVISVDQVKDGQLVSTTPDAIEVEEDVRVDEN